MEMRTFDVQGIEIQVSRAAVFAFVRDPRNLPRWAHAFRRADDESAALATPNGSVEIGLHTRSDEDTGTVDWELRFPDGSSGVAQSRVTQTPRGSSIYSFVLHAPPVPLEQLEGALETQRVTLQKELVQLKRILEAQ
jgi:hypothetical protein